MGFSQDVFFSCLWFGGCRLLRCLRVCACCAPPALLLKDRVVSLDRIDVSSDYLTQTLNPAPQAVGPAQHPHHEKKTPQLEDSQIEQRRQRFAAATAGSSAEAAGGPQAERGESSWVVTLLTAAEIYRGCAVRATHPAFPGARVYAQVVGVPGDVLAVPWRHQQQLQLGVLQQQLQHVTPEPRIVSRADLLLMLRRLHLDAEIEWQGGNGRRLKQQLYKHQRQPQNQHKEDLELTRLMRLEQEHNEQQGIIRQHIIELQQEQQEQQQQQQRQQQEADLFLILRVPPGRCWLESLEAASSGGCALRASSSAAATTTAAAAAAAEEEGVSSASPTSVAYSRMDTGSPATTGAPAAEAAPEMTLPSKCQSPSSPCELPAALPLPGEAMVHEAPGDEAERGARSADDSLSFGFLPLALVEGVILMAAPAPGTRRPHECCNNRSSDGDSSMRLLQAATDGNKKEGGWVAELKRWVDEAFAIASLPANLKPARFPELRDTSAKGTRLLMAQGMEH